MQKESKEIVSWKKYIDSIEILAKKIKNSNSSFSSIVCINRGGLIIGRILSDKLNLPLAIISAKCYDKGKTKPKDPILHTTISQIEPLGRNVLIVDDLVDTGKTIEKINKFFKHKYPQKNTKTAVLYKKNCKYVPDYYLDKKNEWIIFPYETNEYKK